MHNYLLPYCINDAKQSMRNMHSMLFEVKKIHFKIDLQVKAKLERRGAPETNSLCTIAHRLSATVLHGSPGRVHTWTRIEQGGPAKEGTGTDSTTAALRCSRRSPAQTPLVSGQCIAGRTPRSARIP